jgi:hypothetical protein
MDRAQPTQMRKRAPLVVGDRNQRDVREGREKGRKIGQVETTVHGRHGSPGERARQREMKIVDMEMQDVELIRPSSHLIERDHIVGERVEDARIEAERLPAASDELGRCNRIAAREQGHLVALPDKLIAEIGDDTFGAAVEPGRHALDQGRNLRDSHSIQTSEDIPRLTRQMSTRIRPPSSTSIPLFRVGSGCDCGRIPRGNRQPPPPGAA